MSKTFYNETVMSNTRTFNMTERMKSLAVKDSEDINENYYAGHTSGGLPFDESSIPFLKSHQFSHYKVHLTSKYDL